MGVQMFTNRDESYQDSSVQILFTTKSNRRILNVKYKNKKESKAMYDAHDYLQVIKMST